MTAETSRDGSIEVTIEAAEAGERLDRVLAARLDQLSRSRLKSLIEDGRVRLAGATIEEPSYRVKPGQTFAIIIPEIVAALPAAQSLPLDILYEDSDVIVLMKPPGMAVHPGPGTPDRTLVNALIAHCGDSLSGIGGVRRPGIVHRLDKDTSGLIVVAKNDLAHQVLASQFADHGRSGPLTRGYLAFAWGVPDRPKRTIDAPLGRHPRARERMAVRPDGRPAVTHWSVAETYAGRDGTPAVSLLICRLETGRTHQIRVHLAHIGHPVLGDPTYARGFKTKTALLGPAGRAAVAHLERQALHAHLLGFDHPATRQFLEFRSELPGDISRLHHGLRQAAFRGAPDPAE